MKNLIRTLLLIGFLPGLLLLSGCKKIKMATLTTSDISDITLISAKSGGNITDDGNANITARGICWSTTPNPTIADHPTSDGTGPGIFSSELKGLTDGSTYYVRAYATNSEGTAYGNEQSFTTVPAGMASVTTRPVSEITLNSAKSGGDIASDGGAAITAKGICWNTAENPTVANDHTSDGTGSDGFVSSMVGLLDGKAYYIRAYATNKTGTSYGNQVTFSTIAAKAPELTTTAVTAVTLNSAATGGNITDNGGSQVTARGIVWGTAPNPTTTGNKTTNGTGSGNFVSNITGLTPGTVYYVRSYATNSSGTSYGAQVVFSTSISDVEGNIYKTVLIGNQLWMAENLKAARYRDNSQIPLVADSLSWMKLSTPAYCMYRNRPENKDKYGAIYNWFAVNTGNICPDGWHVPTNSEYETLEVFLGIPADSIGTWGWRGNGVGTKMKDSAGWTTGNGNNSSGFKALPGGYRAWDNSEFRALGIITYLWTATDDAINNKPTVAWYRRLDGADTRVYKATTVKIGGKSIRCLKDK